VPILWLTLSGLVAENKTDFSRYFAWALNQGCSRNHPSDHQCEAANPGSVWRLSGKQCRLLTKHKPKDAASIFRIL